MFQNKPFVILLGALFGLLVVIGLKNLNMLSNLPHVDVSVNIEWSSQDKPEKEIQQPNSDTINLQPKTEKNNISIQQKLEEGLKLYEQKRYGTAIQSFTDVINMDPNNEVAYIYRGKSYFYNHSSEERILSDLDRAISINPNNSESYNGRGIAYMKLKNYAQAISDFNKSIELNPKLYQAYSNRAIYYVTLNQYDAAIADCNKVIKLNPNDADLYNNRGYVYNKLKKYDMALSDLNKAITLNPVLAEAYYNRNTTYWELYVISQHKQKTYKKASDEDSTKAWKLGCFVEKMIFKF